MFNDYSVIVNNKKVYRLCKENNLLLKKSFKAKKYKKFCSNRKVNKPNQVWEFDIKHGYIHGENKCFYILVYIDVFSRKVISYHIGLTCKAKNLAATFSTALRKANISQHESLTIRSDNGPQMTSKQFFTYLSTKVQQKVNHEFIPYATPNKNAHVESFYSIIESEFMRVHYFKDFKDVYKKLLEFIIFYNNTRVHGSLGHRAPDVVYKHYNNGKTFNKIKEISI